MKYLLQALAPLTFLILANCSSIPEIQPYQQHKELTIEDVKEASGFYKDADLDDVPTTPLVDDADDAPVTPAVAEKIDQQMDEKISASVEAPVDEPSEAPVAKPTPKKMTKAAVEPKSPKTSRHQASAFKNGLHVFAQDCTMRAKPNDGSNSMGSVQAGKKLWLDAHNDEWVKAYKKSGTVYVPVSCIK